MSILALVCHQRFHRRHASLRLNAALQSVQTLQNIDYTAEVENVSSANGFNYKVIVGPFENRSQTNNAREVLRRFNMDSLEIRSCIKINNES